MKKKHLKYLLICIPIIILIYFGSIIYAFICHSEKIDNQTFNIMMQGKINPSRHYSMTINNTKFTLPLPMGAGKLIDGEYLIPRYSLIGYVDKLKKSGWNIKNENGIQTEFVNNTSDIFYIDMKPYTGAYFILNYYSL